METVSQPTNRPTNKLTAAVLASAAIAVIRWAVPVLDDDALWIGLTPLVILGIGYFVKDAPNIDPYDVNTHRGV